MRMYDVIEKKKHGMVLTDEEIHFFVDGFTKGTVPDYQMSALLMAIYFQGMNKEETNQLTLAMAKSGDMLDLSSIHGVKVDKHSTGGVGDKTSLVLAPLIASLGVPVAKMSGRGLGHTGGTIDKLDSFKGFTTNLSEADFIKNVNEISIAIAGQTANLAPADKKLYALRDVTATVDNISLIASSIMSKKIASGADCIVLDVKCGSGAFMKTEEDAKTLARAMVDIGNGLGRKTSAVISDMNQPLGFAVGNALEVIEAINTLKGNGPDDLRDLCLELGSQMLLAAKRVDTIEDGKALLQEQIDNGEALAKFKTWIVRQGGSANSVDDITLLPSARIIEPVPSQYSGYITKIEAEEIGFATMMLGGGRETKDSIIDLGVGFVLRKKLGDHVDIGEAIATIYCNKPEVKESVLERFKNAYTITENPIKLDAFIKYIIN
ncbi:MAG: pyrimidine-nucleoside phosphorylase [Vallitaleaceae bacterium]|jgi:pyrimidine-nucleoside phosphorylase|nr:pyrimidine-nucleoside phosphorylase [Vallitaleaceae bacterium]